MAVSSTLYLGLKGVDITLTLVMRVKGGMNSRSTLLLEHHLKELKLPSFFREYGKMAAQCAAEGVDHPGYLLRLAELELIDRHQRMVERRNRELPVPFVKAGIVSAMITGPASRIYIDAHGNRGFSGGPVVFAPNGKSVGELRVAGIVSEAPKPRLETIVDKAGRPLVGDDGKPMAYFPENQGLVMAFDIRHATDLIDANPVGLQLLSA